MPFYDVHVLITDVELMKLVVVEASDEARAQALVEERLRADDGFGWAEDLPLWFSENGEVEVHRVEPARHWPNMRDDGHEIKPENDC